MTSKQLIEWLHQEVEEKFKEKIKALSDIFESKCLHNGTTLWASQDIYVISNVIFRTCMPMHDWLA